MPEKGIVGPHAIFDPGMLDVPLMDAQFRAQQTDDPWRVVVKRVGALSTIEYPFNPLDAVGWHGDLCVVRINVRDIRPLMSHRFHLPPSAHTTFVGRNFIVCTFVPRPIESDPGALKVPFYHNNDDYDEVIFYHRGEFFSRDNIKPGMVTFHPCGFTHGPHPKAFQIGAAHCAEGDRRIRGHGRRALSARSRAAARGHRKPEAMSTAGRRSHDLSDHHRRNPRPHGSHPPQSAAAHECAQRRARRRVEGRARAFDADDAISVIVITGNDKAFAAGADIGAMAEWSYQKVYHDNYITKDWEHVRYVRKPVIAAVAGFALGGGCELAMACDLIIAADTAKFGQPEITIGTMPGMGGTQRLPRAVGKAKAMDWCLTGRMIDAAEAERSGLVSRVVPADQLETEVLAVAARSRATRCRSCSRSRRRSIARTNRPSPKGCCSSVAISIRRSRSTTRRKGCAPSSRSGSRPSGTGERGIAEQRNLQVNGGCPCVTRRIESSVGCSSPPRPRSSRAARRQRCKARGGTPATRADSSRRSSCSV
jgi:enoyl-CoA hydratase/carnithine racemase